MGTDFPFSKIKVLEMCCTTMCIYLQFCTVHLEMVKMVNFMLCIFYSIKKPSNQCNL